MFVNVKKKTMTDFSNDKNPETLIISISDFPN